MRAVPHANLLLAAFALLASSAQAVPDDPTFDDLISQEKYCSATAQAAFRACGNQTLDDYWIAVGICTNEKEAGDRTVCLKDADDTRVEDNASCREQRVARNGLCDAVGQGRYDPEFEPGAFDSDFTNLSNPNPYFPLGIGNEWEFSSADEAIKVQVLNATKLIDGPE